MRPVVISIVGSLFFFVLSAASAESPVEIENGWVRAVPPGAPATAAYMVIRNLGDAPLELTGGEVSFARKVKPMITLEKEVDGKVVRGMELVDALDIPAHGEILLKPGGDHLMLMKMIRVPAPGEIVEVTLIFEPGDKRVTIKLPVSKAPR